MSIFDGIDNAKIGFNADYIGAGHFLARIDSAKIDKNRKKEDYFSVNVTILSTLDSPDTCPHTPGQEVAKVWSAKSDYFLSDVKLFFANILGVEPEEITAEVIDGILKEEALNGVFCEIEAYDKTQRSDPSKLFTVVTFKREVSALELSEVLNGDAIQLYLGGAEKLQELITAESATPA